MIRVVVTDDSAFMRKLLSDIINSDPELEVVATARDGADLLKQLEKVRADVITLDISMPVMDGVATLQKIMETKPLPVIMISALSDEKNTFRCLNLGAVDFIPKTSGIISIDMTRKRDAIISKIKAASKAKVEAKPTEQALAFFDPSKVRGGEIVVIGASTGGPRAIESILSAFPRDLPVPVMIVQHMPHEFTRAFAERLNKSGPIEVVEARHGDVIAKGKAYVAPGDMIMTLSPSGNDPVVMLRSITEQGMLHTIDELMKSVSVIYKDRAIGVLLSGIGNDGTVGLKEIKIRHGKTLVLDESSCVVPSMPRNAINAGAADKVIPLNAMAREILHLLQSNG